MLSFLPKDATSGVMYIDDEAQGEKRRLNGQQGFRYLRTDSKSMPVKSETWNNSQQQQAYHQCSSGLSALVQGR